MTNYEYKVIPAPRKGERARGVKGVENRFAHALMQLMNELGAEGWEYQRADTLPCDARSGLTGKTTTFQNVLVFRREVAISEGIDNITENETDAAETDEGPILLEQDSAPIAVFSRNKGIEAARENDAVKPAPILTAVSNSDETNAHFAPSLGPARAKDGTSEVAAE